MAELTLAELAEITVRLERGEPRQRVLAERGLSEQEWLDQQLVWLSRMAAQVERQRHALFDRYLDVRNDAAARSAAPPAGVTQHAPAPAFTSAGYTAQAGAADPNVTVFAPVAPPPLYAAGARPAPVAPPLHAPRADPRADFSMAPAPPAAALRTPRPVLEPARIELEPLDAPAPPPPVAAATRAASYAEPPLVAAAAPRNEPPLVATTAPRHEPPPAVGPHLSQPATAHSPPTAAVPALSDSPRLALQQLALLVADLTVFPERSHATLEQSGLDPSSWQVEWNAWQARFLHHPEERARYDPLVAYYTALIRPR